MAKANFYITLTLTVFVLLVNSAHAQYTIVQEQINVPQFVAEKVAEDNNCSTSEDLAGIHGIKYIQAAKKMGKNLQTEMTTIHIDIKGLFAIQTNMMSMVYNGKFNLIMWDRKKVIQMTHEEVTGMAKQAKILMEQLQKNMPDMSKLFDNANLTEEQKAAAMQAMPGILRNNMTAKPGPTVKGTNKKRTILGMPSKLYLIKDGNKTKGVWASSSNKGLAKKFTELAIKFKDIASMNNNETLEWELLPGKCPLEIVEVLSSGHRMSVKLTLTKEIKKGNPPATAFVVPGKAEGFQVGGKELLMEGLMNR